ncbi:hypothetical protein BAUCODRAFT_444234 [Baudoinia panamericana UAMH 10762]|uniref:Uncharacterized protein n=1 Tax=Baudoinia panamericana (strain UAMH 10762) TaxID=717646 RepID=M2LRW0_BAUPA|nr:uncharacterized protein BAUCODRAFT_444234 [Baudoinia panamericana UAMH 10762]EMC97217.1 hypothetical protein BAUCODRAFT_444234 [Baudoinia panamericana UAMH 10762]
MKGLKTACGRPAVNAIVALIDRRRSVGACRKGKRGLPSYDSYPWSNLHLLSASSLHFPLLLLCSSS